MPQYLRPFRDIDTSTELEELGWAQTQFDKLLLQSIDQALDDLLGERIRNQIFDYMATNYHYGREEIPQRIDEFHTFLQNTFASASKTVGRTIIRRLFTNLGYEFVNVPGFGFLDYLDAAKARFARDATSRKRNAPIHQ